MLRRLGLASALLTISLVARPALAVEVQSAIEVGAPADEVWALIGDFCAISDWHPVIASCTPEQEGETQFRILQTEDGGILREQLIERSDAEHFYRYSILESPLPVSGYVSELRVVPGSEEGQSSVVWESQFAPVGMTEAEAAGVIRGIYDAGLKEIQAAFE